MYLYQNTEVTLLIGPFIAIADNSLLDDLAGTMTVKIRKDGGALAPRNSSTAITYDDDGCYLVTFDAADTDTTGNLDIVVTDPSHYFVKQNFVVAAESFVDALHGVDALPAQLTEASRNDVALAVHGFILGTPIAELSALPGSSPGLGQMIQYVYQFFRFKRDQTSSQQKMYKSDDSTVLGTAAVSDNGTTATVGRGA